jgi:hypothetical protein
MDSENNITRESRGKKDRLRMMEVGIFILIVLIFIIVLIIVRSR